jgi:beta-mannosidase
LEDFVFASQVSQAEAMKYFIERFRTGKEGWRRTGIIWWNLMDGWPQLSDAVVDYYFAKKLAFDFIRRSQQDVCVMVREPENGVPEIVAANDSRREVSLDYSIVDVGSGNKVSSGNIRIAANSAVTVEKAAFDPRVQGFQLIRWRSGEVAGSNHFLSGKPPYKLSQYRQWLEAANLDD